MFRQRREKFHISIHIRYLRIYVRCIVDEMIVSIFPMKKNISCWGKLLKSLHQTTFLVAWKLHSFFCNKFEITAELLCLIQKYGTVLSAYFDARIGHAHLASVFDPRGPLTSYRSWGSEVNTPIPAAPQTPPFWCRTAIAEPASAPAGRRALNDLHVKRYSKATAQQHAPWLFKQCALSGCDLMQSRFIVEVLEIDGSSWAKFLGQ